MRKIAILLTSVLILAGCAPATPDPAEIQRLVAEGVSGTLEAWPTWTAMPTYTPLPTQEPLSTGTPYPTQTPLPTYTIPPKDTATPTVTETSTPAETATPTDTATPKPVSDLSAQQVIDQYNKLTALQAKAYMDGLVGTRVRWTGEVMSVSETGRTGVSIASDKGGVFDVLLLFVYFPLSVEDAIKLNDDQLITFEGDFVGWEALITDLRIVLDNARLAE